MWEIQKKREKNQVELTNQFKQAQEFIQVSVSKYLSYPFKCQAVYESRYRYDISQGFAGWECRIYTDTDHAFYDIVMDRITEDNIEYYVKHAVKVLQEQFDTGNTV